MIQRLEVEIDFWHVSSWVIYVCYMCCVGWNSTTKPDMRPGTTICSATQTVVPWSVLPAQVVYCKEEAANLRDGGKGELRKVDKMVEVVPNAVPWVKSR
jgi:hypothetical protein